MERKQFYVLVFEPRPIRFTFCAGGFNTSKYAHECAVEYRQERPDRIIIVLDTETGNALTF